MDTVSYEQRGAVALITLNNPTNRNALDPATRDAFGELIRRARDDASILAVIITGAGGVFSAGGDLRSLAAERRPAHANRERIRRMHLWMREFINLEKPVIAAVDGPAFGGGFSLALACDFVLCTPRATFSAVFARLGLVPDLACLYLLPRIVGLQAAKNLVFSGRTIDAAEALRLGIAYGVHQAEHLPGAAMDLALTLAGSSTESLGITKSILNQSFHLDQHAMAELEAYGQAAAIDSAYFQDAAQRFLRKEPLRFSWPRIDPAVAGEADAQPLPAEGWGATQARQLLEDMSCERDICAVLARYCRGVDRGDADMISSAYWEDGYDDHGPSKGKPQDFAQVVTARMAAVGVVGQHHVTNVTIVRNADTAHVESYYLAFNPEVDSASGKGQIKLIVGRYLDVFKRRGSEWRILKRLTVVDWAQPDCDGSEWPRLAPFLKGAQLDADPSHAFFEVRYEGADEMRGWAKTATKPAVTDGT